MTVFCLGRGLEQRNHDRIFTAMTDLQLYEQNVDRFASGFALQTLILQQDFQRILKEQTNALAQSLEVMQAEQVLQESEKDPALRMRVEDALVEAKAKLDEVKARPDIKLIREDLGLLHDGR